MELSLEIKVSTKAKINKKYPLLLSQTIFLSFLNKKKNHNKFKAKLANLNSLNLTTLIKVKMKNFKKKYLLSKVKFNIKKISFNLFF
jgi:hypothetical protein